MISTLSRLIQIIMFLLVVIIIVILFPLVVHRVDNSRIVFANHIISTVNRNPDGSCPDNSCDPRIAGCYSNWCPFGVLIDLECCTTPDGVIVTEPTQPPPPPIAKELDMSRLKQLNPLLLFSNNQSNVYFFEEDMFVVGKFINRLLSFIFPLAGMVLFMMLVWGGFEMLTGAASKQNTDAGKQRITAAIIGFTLLFVSYWLTQIVEFITGVKILG